MANNTIATSELTSRLSELIGDPAAIQRMINDMMESARRGEITIVDPSNPFTFLQELTVVLQQSAIDWNTSLNRRQYPSVAMTEDDLFHHMSDIDYIDRFDKPASATMFFLMSLDEIKEKAIPTEDNNGVKKIVIPRNTKFKVGGYTFSIQYPIEIRVMSHGGLQIVYDTSKPSPIQTLETNIVKWYTTQLNNTTFVLMEIPVQQFDVKSWLAPMNVSSGFVKNYGLDNGNFYHARVYISGDVEGEWKEIRTTHSDQIFDPAKLTALLKVYSDALKVEIPTVYFTSGAVVGRQLRVDIYTTHGPIQIALSNYNANQFEMEFLDLEEESLGLYSSPLATLREMAVYSTDIVNGGSKGVDFFTLRERVINNSVGNVNLPITASQLDSVVEGVGYSVVKNLDNITDRQYLITKPIPIAAEALKGLVDVKLLTNVTNSPLGTSIKTLQTRIDHLILQDTVKDNGERITILPTTLYEEVDGILSVVSDARIATLKAMSTENMIDAVNASSFSFTPFHYVLDTSENIFRMRPYFLDKPETIAKQFMEENDALAIDVSIGSYVIEKVTEGYRIVVKTKSGDSFKNLPNDSVSIQAGFYPKNSTVKAYLDGTYLDTVNGERRFEFILDCSDYDLDKDHYIKFNNFQMNDNTPRVFYGSLDMELDFVVVVKGITPSVEQMNVITHIADWMIDGIGYGVIRERINLRLGYSLDNLWANCRALLGQQEYQRHANDVLKFHEKVVYQTVPGGQKRMEIVEGVPTFFKMYSVGDPYFTDLYTIDKPLTNKGTWNANTNVITSDDEDIDGDPMMSADVDTEGWYFTVDTAGNTTIDTNNGWLVGDVLVSVDGVWMKTRQALKHEAGDVILDNDGLPIPTDFRKIIRHLDLCLMDGLYYFATEYNAKLYKETVPRIIVGWLKSDVKSVAGRLLERTKLFFYPKTTIGKAKVYVEEGAIIDMSMEHHFNIRVYVAADVYNNAAIKDNISKTIVSSIVEALSKPTVSTTNIQSDISVKLGTLIKGIEMNEFGEQNDVSVFTVIDDTVAGAIKKRLHYLADGNVSVQDDIDIEFVKHDV